MTLKIPRDFQSYPAFRQLMIEVGNEQDAIFLFLKLWIELGYQCDQHEQAGYFDRGCVAAFNASVKTFQDKPAIVCLLAARVIIPHKDDGDFICPMFIKTNDELSADNMPAGAKAELTARFNRKRHVAIENMPSVVSRLPEDVWMGPMGHRLTLEEMKRAITLTKVVDSVMGQKARQKFEFTLGVIHDAHRVNCRFSDVQIDVILKRLYFLRRTRNILTVPRQAAEVLRRWDDLLYQILPDDGFVAWEKKTYEQDTKKA